MLKLMTHLFMIGSLMLSAQADIPTDNAGEKDMIRHLRTVMDQHPELGSYCLGAGVSGCKAFKTAPDDPSTKNVLLTWQWLDEMKDLDSKTIVVMPRHAELEAKDRLEGLPFASHIITIEGVLHSSTFESIQKEDIGLIDFAPEIIVMLPGDTQQSDGTWKQFTPEMADSLIEGLPKDKPILFLNGPRTGKHQLIEGALKVNEAAHKTEIDAVTQHVMNACEGTPWKVVDFKAGKSLWKPALKYTVNQRKEGRDIKVVMAGESTSMISELRSLLDTPITLFPHPAMTSVSKAYVSALIEEKSALLFPDLEAPSDMKVEPVKPQEDVIIQALLKMQNS